MNPRYLGKLVLAVGFLSVSLQTSATTISLDFNSLPSAQGWTYITTGQVEATIFSVSGTTLHQNSMGTGLGPGGTAGQYYTLDNVVDPTKPFTLEVQARVLESETLDSGGFGFGTFTGSELFEIFMDIGTIQDSNITVISTSIDNTAFHIYRLEATPGIGYNFFVDGSFITSGVPRIAALPNQLWFGDGTSGGNARADVVSFTFQQTVPEPGTLLLVCLGLLVITVVKERGQVLQSSEFRIARRDFLRAQEIYNA